jgi:hypothetical protein
MIQFLTSAVQRRHDTFLKVPGGCKTAGNSSISAMSLSVVARQFAQVAARRVCPARVEPATFRVCCYAASFKLVPITFGLLSDQSF